MLIRFRAKSATGWANRQISLRCLGILGRNIGRAQTLFSGAYRINASNRKPVKFRMRLNLAPIARTRRPMMAVSFPVSADMIKTKPHWSTRHQSADRRPEY